MEIILNDREVAEIREKVQLIETVIDGATQQLDPDKKRLSMALSAITVSYTHLTLPTILLV